MHLLSAGSSARAASGSLLETIRATWHEPSAPEREEGGLGKLTLHARIAPLHVRARGARTFHGLPCASRAPLRRPSTTFHQVHARVARGRFWSDNALLHVGSFEGVELESKQGSVNVSLSYSFEADGLYFSIEELQLGLKDMYLPRWPRTLYRLHASSK